VVMLPAYQPSGKPVRGSTTPLAALPSPPSGNPS
jgi:hypothetical protein